MIEGAFKLGNHESREFPAFIRERPPKVKARRVFNLEEISGVNKLVPFDKGYYTNAQMTLNCFYLATTEREVQWLEDIITEALDTRGQYVDFIPFYDEGYAYKVVVINEPKFEGRRGTQLAIPFSFDLSVAPFKEKLLGREPIEITKNGFEIINHERYPSYPYLKILGSGNITLKINDRITSLKDVVDFIEIDSDPDVMEVFKETSGQLINENKKMGSSQPFPYLDANQNVISWSGNVSKIILEPRWQTKI